MRGFALSSGDIVMAPSGSTGAVSPVDGAPSFDDLLLLRSSRCLLGSYAMIPGVSAQQCWKAYLEMVSPQYAVITLVSLHFVLHRTSPLSSYKILPGVAANGILVSMYYLQTLPSDMR